MNRNISKTRLTRLLICSLMIATILQLGAISMVQATSESIERPSSSTISPEDTVVSNDDQNLISTEEQVISENGELISPAPENTTTQEEIEKTIPADDATIGLPEDRNQENEIPLIAPLAQTEDLTPTILGIALLAIAVGAIVTVFIIVGYKKPK